VKLLSKVLPDRRSDRRSKHLENWGEKCWQAQSILRLAERSTEEGRVRGAARKKRKTRFMRGAGSGGKGSCDGGEADSTIARERGSEIRGGKR